MSTSQLRESFLLVLVLVLVRTLVLVRKRGELKEANAFAQQVDIETRREVGAWLHSTVQPKLLSIARSIRNSDDLSRDQLAAMLDDLNERVVRNYSHQLYPYEIGLGLGTALASLLYGRAELKLGEFFITLRQPAPVDLSWLPRSNLGELSSDTKQMTAQKFLSDDLKYAVYRIIEECVSNAEKKPSTKSIKVTLDHSQKWVNISVIDDGEPLPDVITPSLGSHLIRVLTNRFGGTSSLTNTVTGGVTFRAKLRAEYSGPQRSE